MSAKFSAVQVNMKFRLKGPFTSIDLARLQFVLECVFPGTTLPAKTVLTVSHVGPSRNFVVLRGEGNFRQVLLKMKPAEFERYFEENAPAIVPAVSSVGIGGKVVSVGQIYKSIITITNILFQTLKFKGDCKGIFAEWQAGSEFKVVSVAIGANDNVCLNGVGANAMLLLKLSHNEFQALFLAQAMSLDTKKMPISNMSIAYKVDHIPKDCPAYRRPCKAMVPKYLTIHSTANLTSMAKGERTWLASADNKGDASFHVVVDDKEAIECIPFNEVAWHAGDGNGQGNMASISLEICESGNREKTLNNAIKVAAKILAGNRLTSKNMRRHYDWVGKNCPRILIDSKIRASKTQTWEWFVGEVKSIVG